MIDGGLRRIFRARLTRFDFSAVETGGIVGRGIPDVNYCCDGVEGWIEFKQADHWRATIRPEQVGWAERRIAHGGRVFCAVRRADTELWMFRGAMLHRLKDERLDEVPCLEYWEGGPAKWDWEEVARILVR